MINMSLKRLFIISLVFLFAFNLFQLKEVKAATHELEDLHIQVELNEDGSALIKENRKATLSEGTENYIVISNLGESTIKDFTVKEDGTTYDYVENWDIDATQEEKAFKNGIIQDGDHYELSWGIGEYGEHEYELEYTVTDFIKQLDDSQILFWQFVNDETNTPPKRVTVEIEADDPLTEDNERIWAFGFEGDVHFEDEKIIARSDSSLDSSNYVTILTEFPDGDFTTNDIIDSTFEEIKEEAFAGSDYTKGDKDSMSFISLLLLFVVLPAVILGIVILVIVSLIAADRKKAKDFEGKYLREVPYEGEFQDTYALIKKIKLTRFNHLLSSFILKWIYDDRVRFEMEEKQGFFGSKEEVTLYLVDEDTTNLQAEEKELYSLFQKAAKDGKLEEDRFRKWASKHYKRISEWETDLEKNSFKKMDQEGFVERKKEKWLGILPYVKNDVTEKGEELEGNVYMFTNYLKDYSLLNEHEPANVKLWDEYMIWAALLGITEVVYEQFKKIYPQYEQESSFTPAMLVSINSYSSTVNSAVNSASSGGGGSSSVGGGGGSFGGGSGGGTR